MQTTVRFGSFGSWWSSKSSSTQQQTPSTASTSQNISRQQTPAPRQSDTLAIAIPRRQPEVNYEADYLSLLCLPSSPRARAIWGYLVGSPPREQPRVSEIPGIRDMSSQQLERLWLNKVRKWHPQSSNPHAHYRRANPHEFDELRQLLDAGVRVDASDRYGRNAVMIAASSGHLSLMEFLHAEGANLHATDQEGFNAMHDAASGAHQVADGEEDPHNQIAEFLLDNEVAHDLSGGRRAKKTPFIIAARNGNIPLMKMLKAKGIDMETVTGYGAQAIHEAVSNNQTEAVKLLKEFGADLNAPNTQTGYRPAHTAAEMGNEPMLRLLYDLGASMRLPNNDGALPRDLAHRHPEIWKLGFMY